MSTLIIEISPKHRLESKALALEITPKINFGLQPGTLESKALALEIIER